MFWRNSRIPRVFQIGLIRIPGLVWDECFFSRESEAHAGEIKKYSSTQLIKFGESRASHLGLQCLTVKSWLNIIAVPMGAPTALKNKKTI